MSILLTMAPLAVAIAATTTGTGYATVSAFVSANNKNMLKDEYGMNVQEFTYHKIKESLPPDMSIETEEVDDDDAIQLVINIQ